MNDVKIEKHGITLSLEWDGKSMHYTVPMDEAIRLIGSEPDAWRLIRLLKLAKASNAELERIYTKKKLFAVLNFRLREDLDEFCEALQN